MSDGLDVIRIVPRHEHFVRGISKYVSPALPVPVEVGGELRGELHTLTGESADQDFGHASAKKPIGFWRAIPSLPEVTHFVLDLHHEHRLLLGVLLTNVTQQCGKCTIVTPAGFQ